jgi:hypothetical protein
MLQEMENMVRKVQHNLKEAHDIHKSYADLKRRHHEFQVGDHVYLKVKARRSSLKLGNCSLKFIKSICTYEFILFFGKFEFGKLFPFMAIWNLEFD